MECSMKRLGPVWLMLSLHLISSAAFKVLSDSFPSCHGTHDTLSCNLTGIFEEVGFQEDDWKNKTYKQFHVIGAKSVTLIDQAGIEDRKWNFTDCEDVRVTRSVKSSVKYFGFTNSKASVITPEAVKVLKSDNSVLGKVEIQENEQFDFYSSSIEDLSIHVTGKKSTIYNSNVTRIRNLVLDGDFLFRIEGSRVDYVDKFESKVTNKNSGIFNSIFRTVGMEGLKLYGDQFTISGTTFDNLASKAIVVYKELIIKDCTIRRYQIDSFMVSEGDITFENVVVDGKNFSFAIKNISGGYFPLAALFPEHAQSKVNLGLGVGIPISLVAGILCGAALAYFILQRRQNGQSQDNLILLPETKVEAYRLPSQPPPPTPIVQRESVPEGKDDGEDIYEEYQDVNVNVQSPPSSINLQPVNNNVENVPSPKLPPQPPFRSEPPAPPGRQQLPPKDGLPTPPHVSPSSAKPPPHIPPPLAGPPPHVPPPLTGPPPHVRPTLAGPLPPLAVSSNPPKVTAETPTFGKKPEAAPTVTQPSDSSPDTNDMDLYDEVNERTPVIAVPPSPVRPQLLPKKPSFLHNKSNPKPPLHSSDKDKIKGPPITTKPKPNPPEGNFRLPQWPPTVPLRPPPPPGELKPTSVNNTLEEDENDIYEEIP